MGNSFGHLFRVTTWGESHGPSIGVVIDGCPPRVAIDPAVIQRELDRRRPGQSKIVTQRQESDEVEILSGVLDGLSLGTPIAFLIRNQDHRSRDYDELKEKYRPSHADFAYDKKYGIRAWSGGGRSSARETAARVAAGSVAKTILGSFGVEIVGWVEKVYNLLAAVDPTSVTTAQVEENIVRCPDPEVSHEMIDLIESVRKSGDSVGGVVGCVARGVPAGWGEPIFDKLEADLAKAMMSLPASKGFELGRGFSMTDYRGSEMNDEFYAQGGQVGTYSNNGGGILGGISNGMPITFRVAFKPTATIMHEQRTITTGLENTTLKGRGRHDPCVVPRAVPIVEAMAALVLVDHALRHRAITA